jgi:hypothetical protein
MATTTNNNHFYLAVLEVVVLIQNSLYLVHHVLLSLGVERTPIATQANY